jgi:hypothetical protein
MHLASLAPACAQRRSVDFKISVSGGVYPTIGGETNAPEGTRLLIYLKKPWLPDAQQRLAQGLAACGIDCFPATGPDHQFGIETIVKSGRFGAGPFSFNSRPFWPSVYPLEIFILPEPNTASVEDIEALKVPLYVSRIQVTAGGDSFELPHGCAPSSGVTNGCADTSAAAPSQQQVDPYAGSYHQQLIEHYKERRGAFLNVVRNLYFALGCKVFASEVEFSGLYNGEVAALQQLVLVDRQLPDLVHKAVKDGLARARQPRECDYWQQHPELVYDLRQAAHAAR